MDLAALLGLGLALVCTGIGVAVYSLARTSPVSPPRLGLRGFKRHQARQLLPGFRTAEPALRFVAGWVAQLPVARLRGRADRQLRLAGDYLGLTSDEWIGAIGLGAVAGALLGAFLAFSLELTWFLVVVFAIFGGYMPYSSVNTAQFTRRRDVERSLPSTIDLVALCMSAGMTFPGALRDIVDRWPDPRDPMCEELRFLLRQLELGHSRSYALQTLAERVPTEPVADFVAAVRQAEAKGTPLAKVLAIQAVVMRARRSTLAEEAAAKAAVRMVVPLVMLLMCAFVLIAGPLFLKTQGMLG